VVTLTRVSMWQASFYRLKFQLVSVAQIRESLKGGALLESGTYFHCKWIIYSWERFKFVQFKQTRHRHSPLCALCCEFGIP
jgi:hypothetical protein